MQWYGFIAKIVRDQLQQVLGLDLTEFVRPSAPSGSGPERHLDDQLRELRTKVEAAAAVQSQLSGLAVRVDQQEKLLPQLQMALRTAEGVAKDAHCVATAARRELEGVGGRLRRTERLFLGVLFVVLCVGAACAWTAFRTWP